jgi:hypothetical protein
MTPKSPRPYLLTKYPREIVDAFNSWYQNHNTSKRETYISPRRLDMMMDVYTNTQSLDLLEKSVPNIETVDFKALVNRIAVAEGKITPGDDLKEECSKPEWWTKDTVQRNVGDIAELIVQNPNDPFVVDNASNFIRDQRIGAEIIAKDFGDIVVALHSANPVKIDEWKEKWGKSKTSQVRSYLRSQANSDDSFKAVSRYI